MINNIAEHLLTITLKKKGKNVLLFKSNMTLMII